MCCIKYRKKSINIHHPRKFWAFITWHYFTAGLWPRPRLAEWLTGGIIPSPPKARNFWDYSKFGFVRSLGLFEV